MKNINLLFIALSLIFKLLLANSFAASSDETSSFATYDNNDFNNYNSSTDILNTASYITDSNIDIITRNQSEYDVGTLVPVTFLSI